MRSARNPFHIFRARRRWAAAAAVLLAFRLLAAPAWAGNERIANLTTAVQNNAEATVTAELIHWLTPKLQEDLQNGIPKDLFFYILIKKRQAGWFDEEIAAKTIRHTIKYDTLTKQYQITTRDGDNTIQKVTDRLEDVSDLISKLQNVKITTQKRLRLRRTYYISVKAEMRATQVPFYLEYILFFIPVLELDTPWADSAPFYAIEGDTNGGE